MPAAERWRARAFGLEIEGDFEAPGLVPAAGPAEGPRTTVALASPEEIDAGWRADAAERLLEERFEDEPEAEPARAIDHLPGVGYRLHARHFGLARISEDGSRVLCAPPAGEPWSWQRFLVGRILPWAAVLRGREAFHASAVAVDGRVLALTGPTGAGKTSLALHLVLCGAGFVTDDVLALDAEEGRVRAHPGAAIVSVREGERAAVAAADWARLGSVLGESGKTYVAVDREPGALPLGALYFLARGAPGEPPVEPLARPDPRLLLAGTFVESIRTPARLRRQFELCADLAAQVPLFRLRVAPGVGAAALAAAVRDHASAALAA